MFQAATNVRGVMLGDKPHYADIAISSIKLQAVS